MIDGSYYRQVLGNYPTGVCIVTAVGPDGQSIGMVVGSFTSLSLDPPLVAFSPSRSSASWARIAPAGHFCVNVLAADQLDLCRRFTAKSGDRFEDVAHRHTATGAPLIDNIVAWIDCTLEAVQDGGDHHIVIGRVQALGVERGERPLLFFNGQYGEFVPLG
jgi:flavin reductase (DIM6/NTAB) family NADH-FMN oxidoreductase RutF